MRFTTVLSFLAASMAVLSPVYAAPVSTEAGSAVIKRCINGDCKNAVVPTTTSGTSSGSLTADQVVAALIDTLTSLQTGPPTANNNTSVDVSEPSSSPAPSGDTTTLDELVGAAL